jgi:hypothetical protein
MKRQPQQHESEAAPLRCVMLTNAMSGFHSQHTRNCAATIKIESGRYRICEDSGATKHACWLSKDEHGAHVMACMNVCVSCAERASDRARGGTALIHDAVYRDRWEATAA